MTDLPMAILVTDFRICAEEAIALFVGRWPIETTFQEINQHLGIKTIHTWSDTSVNRTTPTIIASYSLACLVVDQAIKETGIEIRPEKSAWYEKSTVTFSDVMTYLKLLILNKRYFPQSTKKTDQRKNELGRTCLLSSMCIKNAKVEAESLLKMFEENPVTDIPH